MERGWDSHLIKVVQSTLGSRSVGPGTTPLIATPSLFWLRPFTSSATPHLPYVPKATDGLTLRPSRSPCPVFRSTMMMGDGFLRTVTSSRSELSTSTLALPTEVELERSSGHMSPREQSDRVAQQVSMLLRGRGTNTVTSLKNKSRANRLQRTSSQPEKFFTMQNGGMSSGSMTMNSGYNFSTRSQGYVSDQKLSRPRTANDGSYAYSYGTQRPNSSMSAVDGYTSFSRRTTPSRPLSRPGSSYVERLSSINYGPVSTGPAQRVDVNVAGQMPPTVVMNRFSVPHAEGSSSGYYNQVSNLQGNTLSRLTTLAGNRSARSIHGEYGYNTTNRVNVRPQTAEVYSTAGQHHRFQTMPSQIGHVEKRSVQVVQIGDGLQTEYDSVPTAAQQTPQSQQIVQQQQQQQQQQGFGGKVMQGGGSSSSYSMSKTTTSSTKHQEPNTGSHLSEFNSSGMADEKVVSMSSASQFATSKEFQDPNRMMTLEKAVNWLQSSQDQPEDLALASGFIQSACFRNDTNKAKLLQLDGIARLVEVLERHHDADVQASVCGALRNAVFEDRENKRALHDANGIEALGNVLKRSDNKEVLRQATGALWNLSSCEELKEPLLLDVLEPLVQHAIAPKSKSKSDTKLDSGVDPEVFYNATGCLRNLSSKGEKARKMMRGEPELVPTLAKYTQNAVNDTRHTLKSGSRQDRRAGTLENCVCTLRNLSYQLRDEVPARYNGYLAEPPSYPTRDMGQDESMTPGCFSSKASKANRSFDYDSYAPFAPAEPDPDGMEWLWHPEMAKTYMDLLSKSRDNVVVEATAGALQNLTTGNSKAARNLGNVALMNDGGLKLSDAVNETTDNKSFKALSFLTRNLARNRQNHPIMMQHLVPTLVHMLPGKELKVSPTDDTSSSACYAILDIVQNNNHSYAERFVQQNLVHKLIPLSRSPNWPRTSEAASFLLQHLWGIKDLRKMYKRKGYRKEDFVNSFTDDVVSRASQTQMDGRYDDGTLIGRL
uniref:plakophilin-2-like n=1 Tax=Myxine glutinosa TaxID=7769 RepID=UPI00358DEB77